MSDARIPFSVRLAFVIFAVSLLPACVTREAGRPLAAPEASCGGFAAPDLTPLARFTRLNGPRVRIVGKGRPLVPIVVSEDTRFVRAALHLADVIRRASGARPDVVRELPGQTAEFPSALYVGDVSAAKKAGVSIPSEDGEFFRVAVRGSSVFFAGRADYAVYDWCERQLGARCYGPGLGDDGLSVPAQPSISADPVDYEDSPVFPVRDISSAGGSRWALFAKAGDSLRERPAVHVPAGWWRDENLVKECPEAFAMSADGRRAATPMLCYGSPETLRLYERRIDEHIAGVRDSGGIVDIERKVISVSPWDAPVECGCEHCRRLMDRAMGRQGYASKAVWGRFLKRLAGWAKEKHPGYTVAFLPYWNCCTPPDGLDLSAEGNCRAQVCVMPGLAIMKNGAARAREEQIVRRWGEITGRKPILWHYTCWPADYTFAPHLFGHAARRHFESMRNVAAGAFVCAGSGPLLTLPNYVAMRCLWNPSLDVEAVYDGFAVRMFGPAAAPMRRLLSLQERGWSRQWPDDRLTDAHVYGISYRPDEIEAMKSLLDEASSLSAGDAAAHGRVSAYASAFADFFADAEAAAAAPEPFKAAHADVLPALDGRLDDGCWAAAPGRGFVASYGNNGEKPWADTEAKAVWNATGVTFGFRCDEPATDRMPLGAAQEDFSAQDSLAVVLDTTGTGRGEARMIVVDAQGRLSMTDRGMPWKATGVRAAVHVGKGAWSAEIHLPASALPPAERRTFMRGWTVNFIRNRIGDSHLREGVKAEGSRAESSRLNTRRIPRHLDPNALVPLVAAPVGG